MTTGSSTAVRSTSLMGNLHLTSVLILCDHLLKRSKSVIEKLTVLRWLSDCCLVVAKTKADVKVSPPTAEMICLKLYLKHSGEKHYNQAAHGISLFLVDSNLPGFHKGSKLKKLGLKGQVLQKKEFFDRPNCQT